MSLSSLAAAFLGAIGFLLFVGGGWLAVDNYKTLFYETPESVGSNEHYRAERNFNAALWMYVIGIPFFIGAYFARRPQRVKIVKDYKSKDRGKDGEPKPLHNDTNQDIVSVADELGKLAKLKEQGIITEEEFLRAKNDLLKK
jgi:Short C-terminal domain